MRIPRRLTARNAILAFLFIALVWHLKVELWDEESEAVTSWRKVEEDIEIPEGRRTAVVVAKREGENATWLEEYFPLWEKYIYEVDDRHAKLTVPKNKGRESMAYLTFIIDHYSNLPDNILFLHSSRYQWHNDDPDFDGVSMLRRFQFPYLESVGYVNMRCTWYIGCPSEIKPFESEGKHGVHVSAGGDYKRVFKELFPRKKVPQEVGVSCCSQFAVTREMVKSRARPDYIRWRKWLLYTELEDSVAGRVFEYSWHMIFGNKPVHCPDAQQCYCSVFGLCDLVCQRHRCNGPYEIPFSTTLPEGWPYVDWYGKERHRSAPVD